MFVGMTAQMMAAKQRGLAQMDADNARQIRTAEEAGSFLRSKVDRDFRSQQREDLRQPCPFCIEGPDCDPEDPDSTTCSECEGTGIASGNLKITDIDQQLPEDE